MQNKCKLKNLEDILQVLKDDDLFIDKKLLSDATLETLVEFPHTDTRAIIGTAKSNHNLQSFICIRGALFDGHDLAEQAIKSGISLLFVEEYLPKFEVPQIIVRNSRKALAKLAQLYYNDPTSKFFLIGVTGTNGKTSIVTSIESILQKNGFKVGSIGTLGYRINNVQFNTDRTTPDITELNEIFSEMVNQEVQYVVMEVSSHSLKLDRVYGLHFDVGIFTNLSRDHLDFHADMEDYYLSKKILFTTIAKKNGIALINTDDSYGKRLYDEIAMRKIAVSGLIEQSKFADVRYEVVNSTLIESVIRLSFKETLQRYKSKPLSTSRNEEYFINTSLLGNHNAFNLTMAVTSSLIATQDLTFEDCVNGLPKSIPGRLEKVSNHANIQCYIDYAHTPDALENSCRTLKEIKDRTNSFSLGRLITVIGAGGDRDKGKRREMLNSTMKYSDLVIVTSDNPRNEKPVDIIIDMISHLNPMAPFWVVTDRKKAIETAVEISNSHDVILIAGKGHEKYQEINGVKTFFDDYLEAKHILNQKTINQEMNGKHRQWESASPSSIETTLPVDLLQLNLLFDCNEKIDDYLKYRSSTSHINEDTNDIQRIKDLKGKLSDLLFTPTYRVISTDSRTITPPAVYFALQGEHYDGHSFVNDTIKVDQNIAIVDKNYSIKEGTGSKLIVVEDTLKAYALLAKKYFSLFNKQTIAITGSVGKTSTKEFCYNIFSSFTPTLKNVANENNAIGVSRTLFQMNSRYHFVVVEIGSNHFGEIALLSDIVDPDYGIVTNISSSHLEHFIDLDGVFREKSSLLSRRMRGRIVPYSENRFKSFSYPLIRVAFDQEFTLTTQENGAKYSVTNIHTISNETAFDINGRTYSIPYGIKFLSLNASFAAIVATEIGLTPSLIQEGLKKYLILPDRMEMIEKNHRYVLSDCYNANPLSMKSAIDYWAAYKPNLPHIAILGDMLELGSESKQFHEEIGEFLKIVITNSKLDIQSVVTISIGNHSVDYQCDHHFSNNDGLLNSPLLDSFPLESVVLLKGSRSIRLEKIKGRL